ncbi:MAG: tetratricopeptide repeat protein [Candidatus Krumholzibacteriia bacterium]
MQWAVVRVASVALLAMIAFAAVVPGGGYVFDDHVLIERNSDLRRGDVWWASFGRDYYATSEQPGLSGYYRPIAVLCNAFDVGVWRSGPRGSHLTNVILHVLASLAVMPALCALGASSSVAWVVALVFAVHPAHAESVAFIAGRVDVLAALFVLLGVAAAGSRSRFDWLGVGLAALLAFLSKEIAIVLPVLLIVVWRRRAAADPGAPAWPPAQVAAVVAASLFVLFLRHRALGDLLPSSAHAARPEGAALLPLQTLLFSLASLFAPARLVSMEPDPSHLGLLRLGAGAAVVLGVWGFAFRSASGARPLLRNAAIAGGVTLLPVMNLLPQETQLSERFLYLPSVFLLAPLGVLASLGWQRGRVVRAATTTAGVLLLAALLGLSSWRAEAWRTDVRLWRQAVREEPERAAFWDRLGLALTERRSYAEAEQALRRAVTLDPQYFNALHNLGVLLQSTRRLPDAAEAYREALRVRPRSVSAHVNLGRVLRQSRDLEGAYREFQAALQIKPDHFEAQRLAGMTALGRGDLVTAQRHLEAAQRLAPSHAGVRQALEKLRRAPSSGSESGSSPPRRPGGAARSGRG